MQTKDSNKANPVWMQENTLQQCAFQRWRTQSIALNDGLPATGDQPTLLLAKPLSRGIAKTFYFFIQKQKGIFGNTGWSPEEKTSKIMIRKPPLVIPLPNTAHRPSQGAKSWQSIETPAPLSVAIPLCLSDKRILDFIIGAMDAIRKKSRDHP